MKRAWLILALVAAGVGPAQSQTGWVLTSGTFDGLGGTLRWSPRCDRPTRLFSDDEWERSRQRVAIRLWADCVRRQADQDALAAQDAINQGAEVELAEVQRILRAY